MPPLKVSGKALVSDFLSRPTQINHVLRVFPLFKIVRMAFVYTYTNVNFFCERGGMGLNYYLVLKNLSLSWCNSLPTVF